MARNKEFDDALDELKMLHDAKNHNYATAENPYKNLEGVSRIGIEPWRGIVIRLMDKFERVEQYCTNGELAIKSEGMEDTFKDIAVYSTLAMILFPKEQDEALEHSTQRKPSTKVFDKTQEWIELERGKGAGLSMNDLREASEKQQEEEEICKMCPSCGEENKNGVDLGTARLNECYDCGYKYYHAEALARHKYAKRADERRRSDENLAHLKSLMERDANNN
jgi:hypothetical protein